MKGANELHSSIVSAMGNMRGFTLGGGFVPYATKGKLAAESQRMLGMIPGQTQRGRIQSLLEGTATFFTKATDLQFQVAPGSGAVTLQLQGMKARVPTPAPGGGISYLGAAPYSGVMGKGLPDPLSVVEAGLGLTYAERGGQVVMPGISAPLGTPAGVTEWLQKDIGRGLRSTYMRGMRLQRGQLDISKAYWERFRVPVPLQEYGGVNLQGQYADLIAMHKAFSTGQRYGGPTGVEPYKLLGKYFAAQQKFTQEVLTAAESQYGAGPQYSFFGIKEGGVLPHLRKGGGSYAMVSTLDPERLVPFATLSDQYKKGFHQGLKTEVMSRYGLERMAMRLGGGRADISRIMPYLTPRGYEQTMTGMSAMEVAGTPLPSGQIWDLAPEAIRARNLAARAAGDVTTAVPVSAVMVRGQRKGMSDFAKQWITSAFGDSQLVIAENAMLAKAAAGYGDRHYTLKASEGFFKGASETIRDLIESRGGLVEGGFIDLVRPGESRVGFTGEELLRETSLGMRFRKGAYEPGVPSSVARKYRKVAKGGRVWDPKTRRYVQRYRGIMSSGPRYYHRPILGYEAAREAGGAPRWLSMGRKDVLTRVGLQGGELKFMIEKGGTPQTGGRGVLMGGIFRRFITGGERGIGDIANVAMRMEDMKFGTDAAQTVATYMGHVSGQVQSGRLAKTGKTRQILEAISERMGTEVHGVGNTLRLEPGLQYRDRLISEKDNTFTRFYQYFFEDQRISPTDRRAARKTVRQVIGDIAQETKLTDAERILLTRAFRPGKVSLGRLMVEHDFKVDVGGTPLSVPDLRAARKQAKKQLSKTGGNIQLQRRVKQLDDAWSTVRQAVTTAEKETRGHKEFVLKHVPMAPRTTEATIKSGEKAMQYRLTELALFQSRMLGQPGKVGRAYRHLYEKALLPKIARSPAGSDIYRMLAQYTEEGTGDALIKIRGLPESQVVRYEDIAAGKFARMPVPETVEGGYRVLKQDQFGATGKLNLLQGRGGGLRKKGFFLKLPDWYVAENKPAIAMFPFLREGAGVGKEMGFGAQRGQVFMPGFEMFGKHRFVDGRMFLGGVTKVSPGGGPTELKPFGDLMAAYRSLNEAVATGTADRGFLKQKLDEFLYKYNRFASTVGPSLVGTESLLKKGLQTEIDLGFTGKHVSLHPAGILKPGQKVTARDLSKHWSSRGESALDVGVSEAWFKKAAKKTEAGKKLWERYLRRDPRKAFDIFGLFHAYPASEGGHQQMVRVRLMSKKELGGLGEGVIATTEALRRRAQRDLDFDDIYLRIFTEASDTQAARQIYQQDLPAYRALSEAIASTRASVPEAPFTIGRNAVGMTAKEAHAMAGKVGAGQSAWGAYAVESVIQQKMQTPLSHVTFRQHQDIIAMMGTEKSFSAAKTMWTEALGGDADAARAMDQIGRMIKGDATGLTRFASELGIDKFPAGKLDYRLMSGGGMAQRFGEAWTSAIYNVLKKDSNVSHLEDFARIWKGYGSTGGQGVLEEFAKEYKAGRTSPGSRLGRELERLYTGFKGEYPDTAADELLASMARGTTEQGNFAGKTYLQSIYNVGEVGKDWAGKSTDVQLARTIRSTYFEPVAEQLAWVEHFRSKMYKGQGGRASDLLSQIGVMTGQGGQYDRFSQETSGVLGLIKRLFGIGVDKKQKNWVHMGENAESDMAARQVAETGVFDDLVHQYQELVNQSAKKPQGVGATARALAAEGRSIASKLWNTKAGKYGIVGAGALLSYELMQGLFSDDGGKPATMPQAPIYPGGGAPLPPRPLMETAAHSMHQTQTQTPIPMAKVERPAAMRQVAEPILRSTSAPRGMMMGYSSAVPPNPVPMHPEDDMPQVSPWEMNQYLGRVMKSSF